jgi:hypothetical protein
MGIAGLLMTPALRKHRGWRVLLVLMVIYFCSLVAFDNLKFHVYLIHILPLFTLAVAVWVCWLWTRRVVSRWVVALGVVVFVGVQIGGSAWRIVQNPYRETYWPVIEYLKQNVKPGETLMGTAELAFGLGFDTPVIDDIGLGYLTKKRADWIVVEGRYRTRFNNFSAAEQDRKQYIDRLLRQEYQQMFAKGLFVIYARRP